MCEIDNSLNISIITTNILKQPLPTHKNIHQEELFPVDKFLKPAWFWREVGLRNQYIKWNIGNGNGSIWHSPYFTRLNGWKGKEVVTVYDLIYELYPEYYRKFKDERMRVIKKECISNADAVICISHNTQKDVVEFYNLDIAKTYVVPLAPNPIFRQLKDGKPSTNDSLIKPYLLYVGTRRVYKNFSTLIEGYSRWKYRNEVDLLVIGDDWTEEERKKLEDLRILKNIHLHSIVSDEQLVSLYNQALAFVFPSLYEGFGIPLLEAMACGCPIVASRIPTTLEVAGDVPIYFEPAEIESLLSALNTVYQQDKTDQNISAGIEHAKGYSWDKTAFKTYSIYQKII
jgi:glycosyltransferase involved in cell wall biosynthesis